MMSWADMDCEIPLIPLDTNTSDRLLAGAVAPEDAPPGYAKVARLLEAVSGEPTADELAREAELVAMIATAVLSSSSTQFSSRKRHFIPFARSRPCIAAAFVAAGLACSGGLASAGALPDAAQDIASAILGKVGISVPGANAGTHPSVRGPSADRADAGKGSGISEIAPTTDLSGVDKRGKISRVASDGKSRAGQNGSGSKTSAPVATPNAGGTGTADTASEGRSSSGTSTANEANSGRSVAAGTASDGSKGSMQSHRP
jgi:hypothetical protein